MIRSGPDPGTSKPLVPPWEEWASRIDIPRGELWLAEDFLAQREADELLGRLLAIVRWRQPEIKMFGRKIKSPRLTALYGDPGAVYTYSGQRNRPLPWLKELQRLQPRLETVTGARFNSVLLNLYRDHRDSMGWHSDDERELGPDPTIASLSVGATRRFRLRPRQGKGQGINLSLAHGSLLVMAGETQRHWRHCVPKENQPIKSRINLTYRYITPMIPGAG